MRLRAPKLRTQGSEAFDGKYRLAEDLAELAGCLVGDDFERRQFGCPRDFSASHFDFEAGHGAIRNAARVDELEVAQVGGDVEGEAMGSDAARDVNTDGTNLPPLTGRQISGGALRFRQAAPYAGETGNAPGADSIDATKADEGLFHHAHEIDRADTAADSELNRLRRSKMG